MNLIALCIARNEEWCLRATATAAMRWCDGIVMLNHASADGTPGIIWDLRVRLGSERVKWLESDDADWPEQTHRQRTLDAGREMGGTHFVILDADELLSENFVPAIRSMIERLEPGQVLQLPWLSLWRSLDAYRCDQAPIARSFKSMAFADAPHLHWEASGGYHHHHTHPHGSTPAPRQYLHHNGGWMHLQFVNWNRLLWKQRLYVMREIVAWGGPRANYAGTVNEAGLMTTPVHAEWWGPERKLLEPDMQPWQEAECRRLLNHHRPNMFLGHNLFGWDLK